MKTFVTKYLHNSIALSAALSIFLNIIIESASRRSIRLSLDYMMKSPMTFLLNTFIIFATFSIVYFVKRRTFVYAIITLFWLILGIANGVILTLRTTPFTVTDLSLFEDGLAILQNYMSTKQIIMAGLGVVIIILALVLIFIFAPKYKQKINFKKSMAGIMIIVIAIYGFTNLAISAGWVSTYFGNLNYAYRDYGVPYCFVNTWLNTGISPPQNYSKEEILGIFEPGEFEKTGSLPTISHSGSDYKTPNIIMLQLESFFDPTLVKGIQFNQDPIPNFRRLKLNYSSGFLTVPAVGAGTANTEFEVLTGMRIRFFGPGEYPYKSILKKKTVESINYDLKKLGYSTHAIHNHRGIFYGRNEVFPNLGFDTFTSVEYMNNVLKTPKNWEKDGVLAGEILSALNSTENEDFIYTISVQGHGKYSTTKVYENPDITLSGINLESDKLSFEYYLQQIHDMDTFLGELTKALQNFDENTVLVMYGDHLPGFNLSEENLVNRDIYQTQYVIWSNFHIPKKDKNLYSYQLGSEVLKRIGISSGTLIKYHQNYSEDPEYLANLKALQYDMLYGKGYIYGGTNPFGPTDMKMGVKEIKVDKLVKIGSKYYIKGQNFTPSSKISLDGKVLDTIFLGPTILGLLEENVGPADISKMKVSQIDKNLEILSTSE